MDERDNPQSEDIFPNGDIKELKGNSEKRRYCIEQARELFGDSEVMTLRLALGNDWQQKLPELAKKFPVLRNSTLDLILIVGPNVFIDEGSSSANRAWLSGIAQDDAQVEDEEGDIEASDTSTFAHMKLFFGQDCIPDKIDEENPNVIISLYEDEDMPFEIWSLVEEKPGIYVERKSAKRKGEAQRLKISSEILSLAKEMFST